MSYIKSKRETVSSNFINFSIFHALFIQLKSNLQNEHRGESNDTDRGFHELFAVYHTIQLSIEAIIECDDCERFGGKTDR